MLKPTLKEYYEVVRESSDRYQVRSSEMTVVMKGATVQEVFGRLLPLLDGRRTFDEIVSLLDQDIDPELVRAVVDKLIEARFLEDAAREHDSTFAPEELARYRRQFVFFDITTEQGKAAEYQKALKQARLTIIGDGALTQSIAAQASRVGIGQILGANLDDGGAIAQANPFVDFSAAGLSSHDAGAIAALVEQAAPSLLTLALDRPEPALLNGINELSQRLALPLLHAQVYGTEAIVGPMVMPGETACLVCHHLRVSRNLDFYQQYRAWEKWVTTEGRDKRAVSANLAPFTEIAAGMAVLELVKHFSGISEPETFGKFISINAISLEAIQHRVLKLPRCPGCGRARNQTRFSVWQETR